MLVASEMIDAVMRLAVSELLPWPSVVVSVTVWLAVSVVLPDAPFAALLLLELLPEFPRFELPRCELLEPRSLSRSLELELSDVLPELPLEFPPLP